jgi:hypothetical protein
MSKNKQDLILKNIDLSNNFLNYISSHVDLLEAIPNNASIIIYIENDDEFNKENEKLSKDMTKKGNKIIEVYTNRKQDTWNLCTR